MSTLDSHLITEENMIRLLPHILVRVAGGPFVELAQLNVSESWEIVRDIARARRTLRVLKSELSDGLHTLIGGNESVTERRQLMGMRRDIFNERPLTDSRLAPLMAFLPPVIRSKVEAYSALCDNIAASTRDGEVAFTAEMKAGRTRLRTLASNETLRKGLVLSSQQLLKGIERYLGSASQSMSRRDRNTEKSLIKYLSRLYAKTSPFSTFTNLAMGRLVSALPDGRVYALHPMNTKMPRARSHIRLNNHLYAYVRGLLIKVPAIRRHLLIRPNPTLRKESDGYVYLINSNNIEAFQRIGASEILDTIQMLASDRREGSTFKDIVATILSGEFITAPTEEVEAYVQQLLDYGFLEYNIGVSGIDPDWDEALRQKLAALIPAHSLVAELRQVLGHIRDLATHYCTASLTERQTILTEAYEAFRSICMRLHEAAGLPDAERRSDGEFAAEARRMRDVAKEEPESAAVSANVDSTDKTRLEPFKHIASTQFYLRPEQMFYEDTVLDVVPEFDKNQLTELVHALHGLQQSMRGFRAFQGERAKMAHYFRTKHREHEGIDLLAFYEGYYRDVRMPESERAAERRKRDLEGFGAPSVVADRDHAGDQDQPNRLDGAAGQNEDGHATQSIGDELPLDVPPAIKALTEANESWLAQAMDAIHDNARNDDHTVHLRLRDILQATDSVDETREVGSGEPRPPSCSYGAFVQLFAEQEKDGSERLMGVVNSSIPGFGKLVSRFLHIFAEEVTHDIRRWNESTAMDSLLVENCDASYLNANLHPPLMPFEVWMPNGHNSLPPTRQVPVTELEVHWHRPSEELMLFHKKTRKRVKVFDLGFQGHKGRSQLFQLLDKFTGAEHLSFGPLVRALNQRCKGDGAEGASGRTAAMIIRSRVVLDGRLVLQRRHWLAPKALLPLRNPGESTWRYLLRLDDWRRGYGMPLEVFVIVNPYPRSAAADPAAYTKVSRDDHKPQYIGFKNPHLTNLLATMLERVPTTLKIVEMLPDSRQLLRSGSAGHVTECVVQWYS